MSTKNQTTSSNNTSFQYDPQSLNAYHKNINQWIPTAQSWFQNPYGNSMFQQESSIGQDNALHIGQRGMDNALANSNALGYGTNGAMKAALIQRATNATNNFQGQAFRGAIGNANQRAVTGLGMASSFQPLMTGSSSTGSQTSTQSGLGTWLPQVAGMGLGAGMAALTGGASAFGKSMTGPMTSAGAGVGTVGSGANNFMGGLGVFTNSMKPGGYGYGSGGGGNPFMFPPGAFGGY